jgi:hypothetical protein
MANLSISPASTSAIPVISPLVDTSSNSVCFCHSDNSTDETLIFEFFDDDFDKQMAKLLLALQNPKPSKKQAKLARKKSKS